jgi:anti-sigma regulatory factor (Ser/Thr protein kinase)
MRGPELERWSLELPAVAASIGRARNWIAERCESLLDPHQLDQVRLVTSEVVSNAVRHGGSGGSVRVAATPRDDHLRVEVIDEGPGIVPRPRATEPDEHGGFGLFIVEQLTRRWGIVRERDRTRVWFELDYRG